MGARSTSRRSDRGRWRWRGTTPAWTALALGVVLAASVAIVGSPGYSSGVITLWFVVLLGAVVYGVRTHRPGNRPLFWLLAGASATGVAAGIAAAALPPGPIRLIGVDVLYLVGYLEFVAAGVSALPRRGRRRDRAGVMDAVAVGTAGAMLFWAFVVSPRLGQVPSFHLALTAVLYPLFDVVLLFVVVRLALSGEPPGFVLTMVVVALGAGIVSDFWYAAATVSDQYAWGSPADALWVVPPAALAALALHPGMGTIGCGEAPSPRRLTWVRIVLVGFGTFAAPLVIAFVSFRAGHLGRVLPGLGIGSAVLVILSVLRTAEMVREANHRADDLEEAGRALRAALDERARLQEQLVDNALHDELTGLANRRLFVDRAGQAVARLGRSSRCAAVLFLDLDGFKKVNDTLGHDQADQALVAFADRIGRLLRPHDTLARFGGDEFAVLLGDLDDPRTADEMVARVHGALRKPFAVAGREVVLGASVGIRLATAGEGAAVLLRDADLAMYEAKRAGKGTTRTFDTTMREAVVSRRRLDEDLGRALPAGEFVLHYQPVVDLRSGRMAAVEALVRWQHPERGLILPDAFLPAADELGLMPALTRWVLAEGCRWARQRQAAHPDEPPLLLAVNLSPRQLADPALLESVREVLAETGLDPDRLNLEVTETGVLEDVEAAIPALRALRAAGVSLAVDDFGTGYSSLNHLKRLPVDIVKIDRSFVAGLGTRLEDSALVAALVGLAHQLSLLVVAEGIETQHQLVALRELGCEYGQGWLFSKAVDGAKVPPPGTFEAHFGPGGPAGAASAAPPLTVVVADDLEDDRQLLRRALQRSGRFAVVGEAADGPAAIRQALAHQPDVVLLDLMMPSGGGLEALPRIINASPDSRVVMLSGYATTDLVNEVLAAGAAGFLRKSGRNVVDDLLEILRRHPTAAASPSPNEQRR